MNSFHKFVVCFFLLFGGLISNSVVQAKDVDFVKDIKPILEKHCIRCHGPEEEESFRIDVKDDAMSYIEEGSHEDSDFYLLLVSDDEEELMPPPDEGGPLADSEIELIKNWINEGADWPDDVVMKDTSKDEPGETQTPTEEPEKDDITAAPPVDGAGADETGSDEEPQKKKVDKKTQRYFNAVGSLHPAAVHLPIGLLLAAGLFGLLSLRGNFVMSDCAYYCLWLGAIGGIAACVTGWYFSPMEARGTVETWSDIFDQEHKVFWHRSGALVVSIAALLLAMFAAGARNRDPDDGVMWKLGCIIIAAGIGWVGHSGGELHYPKSHYEDLNAVVDELLGGGAQAEDKNVEAAASTKEAEVPEGDVKIGSTSDEVILEDE